MLTGVKLVAWKSQEPKGFSGLHIITLEPSSDLQYRRYPQTTRASDSILRPLLEAAAADALPPKLEEAAAAVAVATSLPYSPPEVAAAAAAAPEDPNPCDFACSIKVAAFFVHFCSPSTLASFN